MHRTYLADIERGGRNVTLRTLGALAKALKVSIPTLLAGPKSSGEGVATEERTTGPGPIGEIMLVDANARDVELTLRVFGEAGVGNPIRVCRDGESAVAHLFERRKSALPQLILLDLNLPKVSGLEVLRRLRANSRTRDIPVVILVVSQHDSAVRESRQLGAEQIVLKPVAFAALQKSAPKLGLQWALLTREQVEAGA